MPESAQEAEYRKTGLFKKPQKSACFQAFLKHYDGRVETLEIQKVAIDKLKPAKYNPRKDLKPGDKEYEKLKRSIEELVL